MLEIVDFLCGGVAVLVDPFFSFFFLPFFSESLCSFFFFFGSVHRATVLFIPQRTRARFSPFISARHTLTGRGRRFHPLKGLYSSSEIFEIRARIYYYNHLLESTQGNPYNLTPTDLRAHDGGLINYKSPNLTRFSWFLGRIFQLLQLELGERCINT